MPFDAPSKVMRPKVTKGKTPMGPSSGAAFVLQTSPPSIRSSDNTVMATASRAPGAYHMQEVIAPTPREDEPNLFEIPSNLSPIYRAIPIWLNLLVSATSLAVVARRIISSLIQGIPLEWTVKRVMLLTFKYIVLWSVARVVVQETLYFPSRVTTQYLASQESLPSVLSKYETVTPIPSSSNNDTLDRIPIVVHFIQHTNTKNKRYAAVQFHHGFGASSLSWLPILPSLSDQLGARVGIAHDAPGFGFTDRPNADSVEGLEQYKSENSVGIGLALLKDAIESQTNENGDINDDKDEENEIAIFGHSMGTKAALMTALACGSDKSLRMRPRLVVLIAPALEGVTLPSKKRKKTKAEIPKNITGARRWLASFWIVWRKIFVDWPFQYVLRRLVGYVNCCVLILKHFLHEVLNFLVNSTKDIWRRGLKLAWGDPQRLTDSDVLRFQWPSIGRGWERGLISFTRAVQSSDDVSLLREVSKMPNATVVIVYGSNDNVVKINGKVSDMLKTEFPTIKLLRMDGLGHDPFEEDKKTFLSELGGLLY